MNILYCIKGGKEPDVSQMDYIKDILWELHVNIKQTKIRSFLVILYFSISTLVRFNYEI